MFLITSITTRKLMETGSETAGGKSNQRGSSRADPEKEAAFWREQHSKQPYAKNYSYEQFEHAYRTGYNSFLKYPGRKFEEVEDSLASDYEEAKPTSALPWDTVRPAVSSVWERMAGVLSPREPGRGVRDFI